MEDKRKTRQARNATAPPSLSLCFRNLPAFSVNPLSREWRVAWLASSTRVPAIQTSLGHPGAVHFALRREKRRPALIPSTLLSRCVCVCVHMCACVSRARAKRGSLEPDSHGRHQCGAARRKWGSISHSKSRGELNREHYFSCPSMRPRIWSNM